VGPQGYTAGDDRQPASATYEGVGANARHGAETTFCKSYAPWRWSRRTHLKPDVVARTPKVNVLHCLRPMTRECVKKNVVRGQYISGDEDGHPVPDYRSEGAALLVRHRQEVDPAPRP